jgi:hypothetical protein
MSPLPSLPSLPSRPSRLALLLLSVPLASCIENRLTVELFTQVHADGSTTRRVTYRLERTDPEKANTRVAIRPDDDPLRLHRFPSGEPWQLREEAALGFRSVEVEGLLPSAATADGDYFRLRAPRAQPARNFVSAVADPERGVYEYQEVLRDPASPLAGARALSRAVLKRDEAFAKRIAAALDPTGPRETDVRRAYREELAEPFAREVATLAERPLHGPRERQELDRIYDRIDDKQRALTERLIQLSPGLAPDAIKDAVDAAVDGVGEELLAALEAQGLPLDAGGGQLRISFRATLVMPVPILRANACVSGDTVVWEFEQEDLFGRGFEMKALAAAR